MDDGSAPTPEALRRAVFREAFRGYHPGRVDALVERAADDLAAGRPLDWLPAPGAIRRCFRGYHRADVDALLDRLGATAAATPPAPSGTDASAD